jgi:4-amino-4-deoxy-L-arabinose transferase-like glycosyltransferase
LLFHGLFRGEVKPLDDGWNMGVARRIAEGGSWLSPTLQDGEFHNHGVLVHWIIAILFRQFGPLPGLARLVGASFGAGLVFATYFAGLRNLKPYAAFIAAFGVLSYEPFFHNAPRPLMDVPVTFWVFLALLAVDVARTRPWAGYLAAGVFTGLAVLTKDLAGLAAIPVAVFLPLVERRPRALLHPAPYLGLAVTAGIVSAWLVPQHFIDGSDWLTAYLKFGRWGLEEGWYPNRGPFFYVGHLAADYWPWLPIFLVALVRGVRRLARGEPYLLSVHLVAFVTILLAWSVAAHRTTRYMMLFLPSISLMVGEELESWLHWPFWRHSVEALQRAGRPAIARLAQWLAWPRWRGAVVGVAGAAVLGLGFAETAFGVDIHTARTLDGARMRDLAPKALAAAHELCTFRAHRYFLATAFSFYRGPTVPIPLEFTDPAAVREYLKPGSSRGCITTRDGLRELAGGYAVQTDADGYVVITAP